MKNQAQKSPLCVEAQKVGFFERPIAYCWLKEGETLLGELEGSIQRGRTATGGLQRSNIGSRHSDTDMLLWGGAAASSLAKTAISIAKHMSHFQESSPESYDWQDRIWANVTPKGD